MMKVTSLCSGRCIFARCRAFPRPVTDFDRPTRQYFDLLDGLGQAVIATDPTGRIMYWSPAAESLYGWSADEVLGRDILTVTPSEVSRAQGAEIMSTLAAGEVWSGAFRVQARDGNAFTASVTDVPLLGDVNGVSGIVGVSAPSQAPTDAVALMTRFAAACAKAWPDQIVLTVSGLQRAIVSASEPHLIQLLSLLVILYTDVLERGGALEIELGLAEHSLFADFGLAAAPSAVYIRIGRREEKRTYSVVRSVVRSAEPTRYALALVRMVEGLLLAAAAPQQLNALHLFLPAEAK